MLEAGLTNQLRDVVPMDCVGCQKQAIAHCTACGKGTCKNGGVCKAPSGSGGAPRDALSRLSWLLAGCSVTLASDLAIAVGESSNCKARSHGSLDFECWRSTRWPRAAGVSECGVGYTLSHRGYWDGYQAASKSAGLSVTACRAVCQGRAHCVAFSHYAAGPHCYTYANSTGQLHVNGGQNVACRKGEFAPASSSV